MYICPTCNKQLDTEDKLVKHFLSCWKEAHPNHKSKPAPRSADIHTEEITDEINQFFAGLQNGRDIS